MSISIREYASAVTLGVAILGSAAPAQQIAVRPLGPVVATASADFGNPTQLVVLSDGRILVNDAQRHLLVALSSTLATPAVVIDSAAGKPNSYGALAAGYVMNPLVRYLGDSVLFYDIPARAILVLDSRGMIGRVMAPPFGGTSLTNGFPLVLAYAPALGFVYSLHDGVGCPGAQRPTPAVPIVPILICDESVVLAAADIRTRQIDTLLTMSSGSIWTIGERGSATGSTAMFPFYDGFTVTRDGAVAILRAREYRLEWVNPDRTRTQSPRLPFDWHQISDGERSHIIDSANAYRTHDFEGRLAQWIKDSTAVGGRGPMQTLGARPTGALAGQPIVIPIARPRPPSAIAPSDVPDFHPPTNSASALLGDAENRVWIRLKPTTAGGAADPLIYDVVDRQGTLIDRVRVPAGRTILGFSSGFAYLTWRDAGVVTLEKAQIR